MSRRRRASVSGLVAATLALAALAAAQGPDRSTPPRPGPPPSLRPPAIVKASLSNGVPVWVVERHEVPVVQVTLVLRAGAAADPPGRFGLASFTAAMIDEGAGSRDALAIADALDGLGAELTTSASFDASVVGLHVPVARLDAALPIMADVVLRPTFADADLERVREERVTSLRQARDNPATIAALAFPRLVYGPAHRYGVSVQGTTETLRTFTRADLQAFHREHYRPDRAVFIVVGDVTAEAVRRALDAQFGAWRAAGPPPATPSLGEPPAPGPRRVYLVDKPGAAQSQVRIGWVGAPRATPDFYAIEVLNTVLGGSFTSRLNQNLREQHGYAYGASSTFEWRLAAGPFMAGAGVQTDKTAEALAEFFKELDGIRRPVPADELARAKNYVALRFPRLFETTRGVASQLVQLAVYGLPDDFFATYVERIQAVTVDDVARVAARYIRPEHFIVVVVGDRQAVEGKVRALGLGAVAVVPVDDVVR
jgi:zinc protease